MAISTIFEVECIRNIHSDSPQITNRNPPQITNFNSMIFKTITSSVDETRTNVLNRIMSYFMVLC